MVEEKKQKENLDKKDRDRIYISPYARKAIEEQKEKVKEVTWDCVKSEDKEILDIFVKKLREHNLI